MYDISLAISSLSIFHWLTCLLIYLVFHFFQLQLWVLNPVPIIFRSSFSSNTFLCFLPLVFYQFPLPSLAFPFFSFFDYLSWVAKGQGNVDAPAQVNISPLSTFLLVKWLVICLLHHCWVAKLSLSSFCCIRGLSLLLTVASAVPPTTLFGSKLSFLFCYHARLAPPCGWA